MSEWVDDLRWSAVAFRDHVWPAISSFCGGGEVEMVELTTSSEISNDLDVLAGIDAWQKNRSEGFMRGIASRVQKDHPAWPLYWTSTVRETRASGTETEFSKRLRAITEHNRRFLYPALSVHSYLDKDGIDLVRAAIVYTHELYQYLDEHKPDPNNYQITPGGVWRIRVYDGNTALVVGWQTLIEAGVKVRIVTSQVQPVFSQNSQTHEVPWMN